MIACGSDHGHIYTFSVGTTKYLQKIRHGSFKSLVQVLSVCISFHLPFIILSYYQGSTTRERYLIASGTNDKMPDINVWEKQVYIYIYIFECILMIFKEESIYWVGTRLQMQLIYGFNYCFDFAQSSGVIWSLCKQRLSSRFYENYHRCRRRWSDNCQIHWTRSQSHATTIGWWAPTPRNEMFTL